MDITTIIKESGTDTTYTIEYDNAAIRDLIERDAKYRLAAIRGEAVKVEVEVRAAFGATMKPVLAEVQVTARRV